MPETLVSEAFQSKSLLKKLIVPSHQGNIHVDPMYFLGRLCGRKSYNFFSSYPCDTWLCNKMVSNSGLRTNWCTHHREYCAHLTVKNACKVQNRSKKSKKYSIFHRCATLNEKPYYKVTMKDFMVRTSFSIWLQIAD